MKIAILGAGNMGGSLITGLVHHGFLKDDIYAADKSEDKLEALKKELGIAVSTQNSAAIENAEVIIFAIKPQIFSQVMISLKNQTVAKNPLIISIAAGIPLKGMALWLEEPIAIVRAMPNTPALIGAGITALFANEKVTEKQRQLAESLLSAVGKTVWVNQENELDTVTALSGSGPAYFFLMMEALENAACDLGLPKNTARLLTIETALGAAKMAIESGQDLKTLREQVTSPGGTTEKALTVLEAQHIRQIYRQALNAAHARSQELAEILVKTK